ncbi:hypothetical protein A3H26_03200 [candidate division WWE3 bacterium RIFCSPLOWO2_12_FULL_36_10]|uniref:Uncharacterized protein n=1 Tax=candidate division WWE3 bacterium RIFCSPLOWO2_12_FULL_36_10 TaxID=1802630 RepID=A0A1F4VG74_UNCKA|nr:MAG: hypothetical protein A3H26_03200 [candidate division WWE3 bacterium RIFCSPLOWO2_12_FULL_36_10]
MAWDFSLFMRPHIKFKLNKSLDIKMAEAFLDFKCGGVDFSRGIMNVHPKLKILKSVKNKRKRKKIIKAHFDNFYKKHGGYLKNKAAEFNTEWKTVESKFLSETNKIFKGYHFHKGKYIGYLSIIDCNPRFIKDKTFQIFYFHPSGARYVVAHELLHFIFYDYAINKFPKIFKKLDTENGIFWDLAEIFNTTILSVSEFKKIHGQKNAPPYPEHKKYIPQITAFWKKTQDIDEWLLKSYEYLMTNKNTLSL